MIVTQEEALKIAKELEADGRHGLTRFSDDEVAFYSPADLTAFANALIAEKLGEPVAWRYKAVGIVNGSERVLIKELEPARCEYEITQGKPCDCSHLNYPLDYPKLTDYEPLYAPRKGGK